MGIKVLLVGSGGREHALAWKLSQSPICDKLYLAPGNALSDSLGERVEIPADDIIAIKYFTKREEIDLTVVGPEVPLVAGIVDSFESDGLKIFGPSRRAAQLEGSKAFSKNLMKKYGIPTAGYETANSKEQGKSILQEMGVPIVIKADGLAEGKGAFVCKTMEEADDALHTIFGEKKFGESGLSCVIEEFMEGEEASLFVLTDGHTIMPMLAAQDHKPVGDGDVGPNTGGMGSYAPAPIVSTKVMEKVLKDIVVPTIHAMNAEGAIYRGLLYVGLMIQNNQPKVVEYNCRFGDPETQPLMTLLKTDLLPLMLQIAEGKLDEQDGGLDWHEGSAIGVVLASEGYPGSYQKGLAISGLNDVGGNVIPFAAGVKEEGGVIKTNGGRVLCLTGRGRDLNEARALVYSEIEKISFEGVFFRKDIGEKGLDNS